jgi:enoyl-CoA hydratase
VTKVVPSELYLSEAVQLGELIAEKPPLAIKMAKETVLKAFDTTLEYGLEYERRCFELLFATDDCREGMQAFLEKREPKFTGR